MASRTVFVRTVLAAAVSTAIGSTAWAQSPDNPDEENTITVTGSRTITENALSPTPLTTVDVSELMVTTPSDTADALNKLPTIMGGRTPRTQNNASTNNAGNTLSLRNFGAARTLVLLDGHRVAPSNQDGSVNVDVLPQMLMKRVDIVTGGASAIYGSDAVAGVVNYVLDTEFTGLSVKADYGLSKYSDGDEYQLGAAWGTNLFDDRGHFEVAARMRKQDMIPISERPYGKDGQAWLLTGNGSRTNPFTNSPYSRVYNSGPEAGNIICGTAAACAWNNHTFDANGDLVPLAHGLPTGSFPVERGGDGAYIKYGTFRSEIEMKDVFTRFDLDLGESANWYVQGSWAQAENASDWIQWVVSPSPGRPNSIFSNNPYIKPETQVLLGSTIDCATLPPNSGRLCLPNNPATSPPTGSTPPQPPQGAGANVPFIRVPSYIFNRVDGQAANEGPNRLYRTLGDQQQWNVETGVTGSFGDWRWDVYYNHSASELTVTNPNNTDNAKYLAALDAVDDNGTIRCWVSTQPEFASLYQGCVPLNITDPDGVTAEMYDYLRTPTSWTLTQELDDVGFSIGGGLWGLGLPAGEITMNFSGELRRLAYQMESDFLPSDFVNCTGLRFCLANGAAPLRWVQNTNAEVDEEMDVYEGALEFNVPLLKEVTGFQDLSINMAGRYTKYEIFDAVESWKLGLNWQVNDTWRFRSTLSSDIRAPNMNDLYRPAGVTSTGFQDRLTNGSNQGQRLVNRGNPDLTPEEAKTFTAGVVFTPASIPRFSVALDFYETRLTNAITDINYATDSIQGLCLASAPQYDSNFCTLAIRPITDPSDPDYFNPDVNMPTEIRSSPLNAALQKTKGYDLQIDWGVDLGNGQFSIRHLASYQPVNSTLNTPASPFYTWAVQPHLMQTTFINYQVESWSFALQNRYLGGVSLKTANPKLSTNQNFSDPSLGSYDTVDVTVVKNFELNEGDLEAFLTVNNVLNERAPLYPNNSGLPGLFYPTLPFYDDMGRYFTTGVRVKF